MKSQRLLNINIKICVECILEYSSSLTPCVSMSISLYSKIFLKWRSKAHFIHIKVFVECILMSCTPLRSLYISKNVRKRSIEHENQRLKVKSSNRSYGLCAPFVDILLLEERARLIICEGITLRRKTRTTSIHRSGAINLKDGWKIWNDI